MILDQNPILDEASGAILRRSKNLAGINKWLLDEDRGYQYKSHGLRPTWVAIDQLRDGALLQIGGEYIPTGEIGGPEAVFVAAFADFSMLLDWVHKKRSLRFPIRDSKFFVDGARPPHTKPARFGDLSIVQIDALLAAFPGGTFAQDGTRSLHWLRPDSQVDPAFLRVMIDEALTRVGG